MRILLVDDHRLFCSGLRLLLERVPGFTVVAEAGDAESALAACAERCPDVMVADVHLPGGTDGIELARAVRARCQEVRIVFLSSDGDFALVQRAIEAGGNGYLLKDNAPQSLIRALDAVHAGGVYLCPEVAAVLAGDFRQRAGDSPPPAVTQALSVREKEVLLLIVEGLRNKEIAARLCVSVKSVETYRTRLLQKLGYTSTAELVRYAIREGVIEA